MKKLFIFFCLCFVSFSAYAGLNCYDDESGFIECYGVNSNGENIHTFGYYDDFGYTETYGSVGDKDIFIHSYKYGDYTESYGSVGDDLVDFHSYSYGSEYTESYGTVGEQGFYLDSYSDSSGYTEYYD